MIGLLCFALAVLASPFKSKLRLEAENAVLRHQLIVLKRRLHGRVRLTNNDRWFFIQLYRWCLSILQVLTIIRPETLVRWHRAGFRCYWRWKSRSLGGRPQIETDLRALIRRMSVENPLWGAPRIHGELLKLGFEVAQSSVAKYMIMRRGPPGQEWRTFLRNHAPDIAAMDLFVVPTIGFDPPIVICCVAFRFYKIDRLTRSLADFAKLVEAFDARSISFVAVTQQFNTTTSMGRLTLNVLLSFAQFERELSSERVRDKVAASRRKGKWTGGTVPLGYVAKDKNLVIDPTEAETVRTIFRRYIELQSFGRLVADLDKRCIVTKRRNTKVKKFNGGIPFTYGPLAHFLKNRIYIGETGHGGKWYPGEHKAIVDRKTFDKVQELLEANKTKRKVKRSESGALLMGKLFDDRGNAMSPSFSSKNSVRYKFYVSSALLRGRKLEAGKVARVPATDIEQATIKALRERLKIDKTVPDAEVISTYVARADLSSRAVKIITTPATKIRSNQFSIPWQVRQPGSVTIIETDGERQPDAKLVQAIVRAHAWMRDLKNGKFDTVEALAASVQLHPKLVRQELRYAFLAPSVTEAILTWDKHPTLSLARIPKTLPLAWVEQSRAVGF